MIEDLGQERGDERPDREGESAVRVRGEAAADEDVRIVVREGGDHIGNRAREQDRPLAAEDHIQRGMMPDPADDEADEAAEQIRADGEDTQEVPCPRAVVLGDDVHKQKGNPRDQNPGVQRKPRQ